MIITVSSCSSAYIAGWVGTRYIGDRVHYPGANDPVYESTANDNVWAPDVYGWALVE